MNNDPSKLKMYIFIKESLPSHKGLVIAHGVLMAHLRFCSDNVMSFAHGKFYKEWLEKSFRKVICEVSDEDFNKLKETDENKMGWAVIVTESGLGGIETGIIFCPQPEWPKYFRDFKLSDY